MAKELQAESDYTSQFVNEDDNTIQEETLSEQQNLKNNKMTNRNDFEIVRGSKEAVFQERGKPGMINTDSSSSNVSSSVSNLFASASPSHR